MYLTTSIMWGAIGVPATKAPISWTTLALYVLPPLLLYFFMAVLAIKPQTRYQRVACWPVVTLLALRAAVSVDISPPDSKRNLHNGLEALMVMIVTRSLYWASIKDPLVRQLRPANNPPSTLMDAFDLVFTFRGYGWDWSRGLYIPRETRPSNRTRFVLYVTVSAVVHAFVCGALRGALRSFFHAGFGPISGASIFDGTLPFHLRYLRSSAISVIGCLAVYSFMQMTYDLCTLTGILILGQDPVQWPPSFDAPWRATSVGDFWGRRWHQWIRHLVLVQGGYPLSFIFGHAGLVIGAFLSSGVYHHVLLCSSDTTSELWRMLVGFGMMGPGMLAEQAFKRVTGRKVRGWAGWVWTMTWLLLWGNVLVDGFLRVGVFRNPPLIDSMSFLWGVVERAATDFDTWLHAV